MLDPTHDAFANTLFSSFVEFESAADLRTAVEKLDGREFKGQRVQCVADVSFLLRDPCQLSRVHI